MTARKPTTLSANWQHAFVWVMVLNYVVNVVTVIHLYTRPGTYISTGTWLFQVSGWAYPLLSACAGLLLSYQRYKNWLNRVFWAVLLAAISTTAMGIVMTVVEHIRQINSWFYTGNSTSYWLAFGWEWTVMLVTFGAYLLGLAYVMRKGKRR